MEELESLSRPKTRGEWKYYNRYKYVELYAKLPDCRDLDSQYTEFEKIGRHQTKNYNTM